ncbi:MAG: flagellar biosynthetic protein FliR, partial [Rhodospirillales bacterium]|nr:flagellar biosynthetic protein FliR [Rhodospirillales bacterium]
MEPALPSLLAPVLGGETLARGAWAFLLVLSRVGPAMLLLPGLGEAFAPGMLRAGLAFGMALLIWPLLQPVVPPLPETGLAVALAVAAEAVTGLWFGWLTRLWVLALAMAGQVIAYLLGLASVLQADAELGPQSTALSRLFALAAPLVVLSAGLYTLPLRALVALYDVVPPGTLLPVAAGAARSTAAVGASFALALQLASPFVVAAIVWHVAIGLAARLVPRMQVYFVAMPGQILGGLLLLAVA